MGCFVYLLECRDKSYYCGWTTDLQKRLQAHSVGSASKYTRARRPIQLVYSEMQPSKESAMRREAEIKKFRHQEKRALINAKRE